MVVIILLFQQVEINSLKSSLGPLLLENVDGKAGQFYTWLGKYIQESLCPKAIVVISAHWQAEGENTVFGK